MNKLWKIDETACCAGFGKMLPGLFWVGFFVTVGDFLRDCIRNLCKMSLNRRARFCRACETEMERA